ncbi:hypothetical protein GCM10010261_13790 [Streptomyces pilosus]|nr:hypothetical protein GCM10010261_13790 [Streptomyces pilosus]
MHSGSVHGAGAPAFNGQWYGAPGAAPLGGGTGALPGRRPGRAPRHPAAYPRGGPAAHARPHRYRRVDDS